jgi:hypothetical protein
MNKKQLRKQIEKKIKNIKVKCNKISIVNIKIFTANFFKGKK